MSPRSNSRSVPHKPQNAGRTSTSPAPGTSDARSTSAISPGLSTTRARLTLNFASHREEQTRHSAVAPPGCQRRSVDTATLVVRAWVIHPVEYLSSHGRSDEVSRKVDLVRDWLERRGLPG